MHEANLTRFGPSVFEGVSATASTFRALEGPGKLILWNEGIQNAQIKINGLAVQSRVSGEDTEVVIPIDLNKDNTINK